MQTTDGFNFPASRDSEPVVMGPLYSRNPAAVSADLGEELAVLHMRSGSYLGFNATAAAVWRLLEQPRSIPELAAALSAQFDVDDDRARGAVTELIADLRSKELVVEQASDR